MKSHSPFFDWMEMLPSSLQHNLEQECSLHPIGPRGLLHTHIYLLPVRTKFHHEQKPCSPSHWAFHNSSLPRITAALPSLRLSAPTLALRDWLVSQTLGLCAFLFYFLLSPSTTLSNPLPSIHWSSISPWAWTIILLHPWTLSRTFISIHLCNGIVNDLRGVNHSQDNGCKKLIDMIFMI